MPYLVNSSLSLKMATKAKKVLLFGWDAADWKTINPLMDKGLMPNMRKVVENGVIANLATLDPAYSPMLWSSIATGKRPYKHGVYGFTEPTPDGKDVRPVMSVSRKCKAIWNILTQQQYRAHVVGWWPSHPAEPINGVMISNFYQQHKGPINEPWPVAPGTIHPAEQVEQLAQFRVHPQELTGAHLQPFIPDLGKIDQRKDKRPFSAAKVTAHAASSFAAFTHIIRTQPWDFAALYLDAIDHYCHGFMKYHPPKRPHIKQEDYDFYHNVVTQAYIYHDMMLGTIMSMIDEDTALVILSDHGFQPDHLRPKHIPKEPAGPAYEHSPYGIFAAMGPGIKKDQITFGASLLDICPTLLTLMGLPVGEDMDGRVLTSIFETPPDIQYVPSWEDIPGDDGMLRDTTGVISEAAANEAMQQLEDLGYIEPQTGDKSALVLKTQQSCDFNLARAYIDGGLHDKAVPILEKLHEQDELTARYSFQLATCYQTLGRLSDARKMIEKLREQEQFGTPALDIMEATLLLGERQPLKAIKLFKAAELKVDRHHARINLQLAQCYMMLSRWEDAERMLEKEISWDFDTPQAHYLLGNVQLRQKNYTAATDAFLNAIGLDFNHPMYHQGLGNALFSEGKYVEAVRALENALAIAPELNGSRELLMKIYKTHLDDYDKYIHHKQQLGDQIKGTIYVVSGLPRSGTSMMMQMLEKGGLPIFTDGKREQDENNPKGYYEHEAVKTLPRNKKWVPQANGKVVKVIAQLLPHLPPQFKYKVIFMERDLHEVLSSQRTMLTRLGKRTDDEAYPLTLMETYTKQLNQVKEWASSRNHVEVLYVEHQAAIHDPFGTALQVNEFLGGSLLPEQMAGTVDHNLHREKK
jgi:predicted AlkP superfamily phosphohydrolase/phosphomutase/tetratricopeptide (TPR) repeat protein